MFSNISYLDQNECSEGITVTFAQAPVTIVLRIIAVITKNNGNCYLGIDESTGRILRPIKNTEPGLRCWPSNINLCLELTYRFGVILNPDNTAAFVTQFPHCKDDMVHVVNSIELENTEPFNTQVLMHLNITQPDIIFIFTRIKEWKNLNENKQSRSAGILRCSSNMVSNMYISIYKKLRSRIILASGLYDLPVTALRFDVLPEDNKDIIVVLGLGRPYSNSGEYKSPRYYILVVGLFVL